MPSRSRYARLPLALTGALLVGAALAPQTAPPVTDEQLRAAFNTADANRDGDGRLSAGEVAADHVYELFLMDTNRNGVVTFEEVHAYADTVRNAKR